MSKSIDVRITWENDKFGMQPFEIQKWLSKYFDCSLEGRCTVTELPQSEMKEFKRKLPKKILICGDTTTELIVAVNDIIDYLSERE